jgi:hypothetical protein
VRHIFAPIDKHDHYDAYLDLKGFIFVSVVEVEGHNDLQVCVGFVLLDCWDRKLKKGKRWKT